MRGGGGRKYAITYFMINCAILKKNESTILRSTGCPVDSFWQSFHFSVHALKAATEQNEAFPRQSLISVWNPWFGFLWEMQAIGTVALIFLLVPSDWQTVMSSFLSSARHSRVSSSGRQISSRKSWGATPHSGKWGQCLLLACVSFSR